MIYTLTLNPSIDYIVDIENFSIGNLNRCKAEKINAGGKGINVSIVLNNLGIETCALGFVAGFTGIEIENALQNMKIKSDFVHIKDGFSRINIKMRCFGKNVENVENAASAETFQNIPLETEINGLGPKIFSIYIEEIMQKLQTLQNGDTLVLAGSIPKTLPSDFYCKIMQSLQNKSVNFVVDATGDALLKALQYKPFLVKPNLQELADFFGISKIEIKKNNAIEKYAKKLQSMGAKNVLVSLAEKGALLVFQNGKIIKKPAPKCNLVNSVGAGDSMIAGFLASFLQNKNYETSLKFGISAGTASASSENLATKAEIEKVYKSF